MKELNYPASVYIIRHAEKPKKVGPNRDDLSPRGHLRAHGLALLPPFPQRPDYIFATKECRDRERANQTITPFARSIKRKISAKFATLDFYPLVHELLTKKKYHGKVVLICWHHEMIHLIIKALGGQTDMIPFKQDLWPENVFDQVVHLTFKRKGSHLAIMTESFPQKLLFNDNPK